MDNFKELQTKIENESGYISVMIETGGMTMRNIINMLELSIIENEIFIESDNMCITISTDEFKIRKTDNDVDTGYILFNDSIQIWIDFI